MIFISSGHRISASGTQPRLMCFGHGPDTFAMVRVE